MTKNIKLTEDYHLPDGMKCIGGYDFFNYTQPSLAEGEFYKSSEIPNDPDNVPVYDSTQCTNIIRTMSIECYGCHYAGESIEVPTVKADEFLAMTIQVRDNEKMIGLEPNPNYNKIISKNIFEEIT